MSKLGTLQLEEGKETEATLEVKSAKGVRVSCTLWIEGLLNPT